MPTVLAQSNLPKSAAVVVSSETIILRDPNNSIIEKYTSDEQKQLSLKSYGIKPATLLSPGENKTAPMPSPIVFYNWLQNIGHPYIDSLILPKSVYKYEFAVVPSSTSTARIFGSRGVVPEHPSDLSDISGYINGVNNNGFSLAIYMNDVGNGNSIVQSVPFNFAKIVIDEGKVYVNDEQKAEIPDLSQEFVVASNLFIFARSDSGTPSFGSSFYLAYFKIYDENSNILRDFVPASQDGVFGLYDRVSAKLFVNSNNEGSFVGSNDEPVLPVSNTLGFGNISNPDIIDIESESM